MYSCILNKNMFRKIIFFLLFLIALISSNISFAQNIPMTFHNGSFFSIYLNIPGVMNPNLLPKSNSGVSLDVGQVVYFFPNGKNGKKQILFTVSPNWKSDTILQIDDMIKAPKKSIGYN
jgi:hypothetical protein